MKNKGLTLESSNDDTGCRRRSARLQTTSTNISGENIACTNKRTKATIEQEGEPPSALNSSEATLVSLSTLDHLSPKHDNSTEMNIIQNNTWKCFTGPATSVPSKSELSSTLTLTNVSSLSQSTGPSTGLNTGTNAGNGINKYAPIVKRINGKSTRTRRSKRLTSARIEFNKKQRCRLFVKPKPANASSYSFTLPLRRDEHQNLQQAILENNDSMNLRNGATTPMNSCPKSSSVCEKNGGFDEDVEWKVDADADTDTDDMDTEIDADAENEAVDVKMEVDIDAISKRIAFLPSAIPSTAILKTSPESHLFTYLYKGTYGSDYHVSLLDRESKREREGEASNSEESDTSDKIEMNGRPRTRSICREEEKEGHHRFELEKVNDNGRVIISGRPRTRSICRGEGKEHSRIASSPSTSISSSKLASTSVSTLTSMVPSYITNEFQNEISVDMRSILVDWILDVARELNLAHETTHFCIKLMDRGLSLIKMTIETFHTYGCACLLIACKLIEVTSPRAVDIAFFTDSACNTKEICDMEMKICLTLKFDLQDVTIFHFLDRFLDASNLFMGAETSIDNDGAAEVTIPRYCPKHHAMSLLIIDTALLIPALVDVKDSLIAAAALYLSRAIIGVRDKKGMIWNNHLTYLTGYSVNQLAEIVSLLHFYNRDVKNNAFMKAIVKKYKSSIYHQVAYKTSILPQDLKLPY